MVSGDWEGIRTVLTGPPSDTPDPRGKIYLFIFAAMITTPSTCCGGEAQAQATLGWVGLAAQGWI